MFSPKSKSLLFEQGVLIILCTLILKGILSTQNRGQKWAGSVCSNWRQNAQIVWPFHGLQKSFTSFGLLRQRLQSIPEFHPADFFLKQKHLEANLFKCRRVFFHQIRVNGQTGGGTDICPSFRPDDTGF